MPLPRRDTLIQGARLLDGVGQRVDGADVRFADGRVVEVGSGLAAAGCEIVEAAGKWLTPGLIDPHSHAGNFPAPYVEAELAYLDVNEETLLNAARMRAVDGITTNDPTFARALAGGVTLLHILPGSLPLFPGQTVTLRPLPAATAAEMVVRNAPTGLKMSCGENPKRNFASKGQFPTSRMGMLASQRETWERARIYAERRESQLDPDLEPLAAALRGEIAVHIHAYRADDMGPQMEMAARFGYRIAAFHHAVEGYKIASQLASAGIAAVAWSDWWGFKAEAADGIRENAAFLDAAGVTVALHSDIPQILPRLGVEAGKAADLVLWRGDPLSVYGRPDQVWVEGALAFAADGRRARSDQELRP